MTQRQYEIVKMLQRIWLLKQLFARKDKSGILTKQAEIELAGQAAAKNRPPLDVTEEAKGFSAEEE